MKIKKQIIASTVVSILILLGVLWTINNHKKFDINENIGKYNLSNNDIENQYLNYLKEKIEPEKIRKFIENSYVPTSLLSKENSGNDMIDLMKETGYEILFNYLFNYKEKIDLNDCPVSSSFKDKYKTNLLDYYNLKHSNDCEVNCIINQTENELFVELYDDFKNTEPTYTKTYYFHYTLDSEGNVDDVIFDKAID